MSHILFRYLLLNTGRFLEGRTSGKCAKTGFSQDRILKISIEEAKREIQSCCEEALGLMISVLGFMIFPARKEFMSRIAPNDINFTILSHFPVANLKSGKIFKNCSDGDFGSIVVMFRHRKLPGGEEI